ncbi:MAG: ATP-binding protein [Flavobacteriales bacterium]
MLNSLKLLFSVFSFILFANNFLGQNTFNHDSISDIIVKLKTENKKTTSYIKHIKYYILSEIELKSFNKLLLRKVEIEQKEYIRNLTRLTEGLYFSYQYQVDSAENIFSNLMKKLDENNMYVYARAVNGLTLLYYETDNFQKAISFSDSVLSLKSEEFSKKNLGLTYQYRALSFRSLGYINTSTRELLIADTLLEEGSGKIANYIDLSKNFSQLNDLDNAKKYMHKAIYLCNKLKNEHLLHLSYLFLGRIYQTENRINQADSMLRLGKEYFSQDNYYWERFDMDFELLKNKRIKKENDAAIKGLKKYLSKKFIREDPTIRTICFIEIAKNLINLKDVVNARIYLDSASNFISDKNTTEDFLSLLNTEYELEVLDKNYLRALKLSKDLDSAKNENYNKSNLTKVNELKYFYQTEKKERENLTLKTEKAEIEKEKQSQFYQLLIGIILLSLGLILVYLLYKNRQKRNAQLEELDKLKSKFFESISHELRTPLTLIKLPITKAIDKKEPIPEEELNTIKYNANRLENLMDDLLSITRIEANKYPLSISENPITEQTKVLTAQFDSLAESNNIDYIKTIENNSLSANYDKEVYNKIVINLISNAIKYSEKGGKVEVDFKVKDNKALLSVKDQGKGIRKEDQKYIFDKFYRVDNNNENVPGSGIGLSIVKELLSIIGGSISFESEEGKGTHFYVEFPLENIQEIAAEEDKQSKSFVQKPSTPKNVQTEKEEFAIDNAAKPHLLIVEDNEELLDYIKQELREEFKILTANNGKLGIEKGIETVPDLIISDWLMPEKNGIELCKAIKENEITSHVPVVMLTAKTEVEDKIKGFETGADAYVAKPFEMDVLKAQVNNIINQRKRIIKKFNSGKTSISTKEFSERDILFWNKLKKMVNDNISNPNFSNQTLANELLISRMQLNRKMKALVNLSGSEYILNERINCAKILLKKNELQVSEISYEVGYDNVNSFSRAFKKETGHSPSEYKKSINS